MNKKELEDHFAHAVMMNVDANKLLYALLMDHKGTIADIRASVEAQEMINKTYLDAFDAAADEHELNAIIACVRHSEPVRREEVASKAADFRTGKIKV